MKKLKKEKSKVESAEAKLLKKLQGMDRGELKAFIKEEELEVNVKKADDEDDVRKKILAALEAEAADAEDADEDEEEEDEEETDDDEADEDEESDDEEESDDDEDEEDDEEDEDEEEAEEEDDEEDVIDLDSMSRSELKAFIKEQELDVKVTKSLTDEALRSKIQAAVEEGSEQEEEPAEKSEKKKKRGKSGAMDWMFTGGALDDELKAGEEARDKVYAPTFYVPDGEDKVVRFRDDAPICGLYMYNVCTGPRRWEKIVQPPDSDDDMMAKAGKRPAFYLIYELIDRSGYVDKKKKKHVNEAKFWIVGDRIHKQLQHLRSKYGSLTKKDIEIHREGGQKPVYTMMTDTSKGVLPEKVMKQARLSADIAKYFAPPTLEMQRRYLRTDGEAEQAGD